MKVKDLIDVPDFSFFREIFIRVSYKKSKGKSQSQGSH